MTTLINFGHPLSTVAAEQLREAIGEYAERRVRVQLDVTSAIVPQVVEVVDTVGLTPDEWQTLPLVVLLPGLTSVAGMVIAEIHGRSGCHPRIVHLVRNDEGIFELGEVIDLELVRREARQRR